MTERDAKMMLEPCPFCASQIRHVESWAKSFDPPRLYHEWHHDGDSLECPIRGQRKIVCCATDDPDMQAAVIRRWNTRATAVAPIASHWTIQESVRA